METFSTLLAHCAENSPATGEFPAQRPVTRSFDVFFDLRLNKRLSKQWWGWRFETPSHPLWRHINGKWRWDLTAVRGDRISDGWITLLRFKNGYGLLNLRALKISMLYKNHTIEWKGTFEIPHNMSYLKNEKCRFYSHVKIWELLDLRAHKCFWKALHSQYVGWWWHGYEWSEGISTYWASHMGLLPNTQNRGCACAGNAGNVFPVTAGKRSRHASQHVRHARAVMHAGIAN